VNKRRNEEEDGEAERMQRRNRWSREMGRKKIEKKKGEEGREGMRKKEK
jgi:hypothetical protein